MTRYFRSILLQVLLLVVANAEGHQAPQKSAITNDTAAVANATFDYVRGSSWSTAHRTVADFLLRPGDRRRRPDRPSCSEQVVC